MINPLNGNRGFFKAIILIVIVLMIFAYYGFDLKEVLDSLEVREKASSVWNWIKGS